MVISNKQLKLEKEIKKWLNYVFPFEKIYIISIPIEKINIILFIFIYSNAKK